MVALSVQAAYRVLDAGYDLRSALADHEDVEYAVDGLAAAIEASMITFDAVVQGFSPSGAAAPAAPDTVEELLAGAVGQIRIADVALTAGHAVGEDDGSGAVGGDGLAAFDAALAGIGSTAAVLDDSVDERRSAFESGARPPADLPAAVALVRERTAATLGTIAASTADVFTKAVDALRDHGPELLRNAWQLAVEKLDIAGFGGRLLRLGLRALGAALDALHRVVPTPFLLAARDQIRALGEALGSATPAVDVTRWALAIDAASAAVEDDLARNGLQAGRLGLAAASLDELSARCERLMQLVGGASLAVVGVSAVAGLFQLAIPNLPVILAATQVLVLSTALVLGREFVDAGAGPGWVRGVRDIVRAAVAPT